jgi:nucleoredoxin
MENFIGSRIFKEHKVVPMQALKEYDIILLYIGAQWSPPCRNFLPELLKFYEHVVDENSLEIVFVSCDRSYEDFVQNITSMPWCYIPFTEQGVREIVVKSYEVTGIPSILLVNHWGECISDTCIHDIANLSSDECIKLWGSKLQMPVL